MSNLTSIEINQAEGPDPLVHTIHSKWENAAVTLWGICLAKERDSPRQGYWKCDVTVLYEDGSWKRFRFDACKADSGNVHTYEKFAANTLLWSTSKSHPEE
jgi:hypothetical protein